MTLLFKSSLLGAKITRKYAHKSTKKIIKIDNLLCSEASLLNNPEAYLAIRIEIFFYMPNI